MSPPRHSSQGCSGWNHFPHRLKCLTSVSGILPGAQPCARCREALVKRQEETGLLQEVQLSVGHRLAARSWMRLCSCAGLAGPRVAVEKNSWRKET